MRYSMMAALAMLLTMISGVVGAAELLRVEASKSTITVTAKSAKQGVFWIEALKPWQKGGGVEVWKGPSSAQKKITFPRILRGDDLLYRRFRLVDVKTGSVSNALYVTDFTQNSRGFRILWPKEKKGMSLPRMVDDLKTLGVKHATLNLVITGILKSPEAVQPGEPVVEVDHERYGINLSAFRSYDHQIKELTDAGINIIAVICNFMPMKPDSSNPLIHPESDLANAPTRFGAINITDDRGWKAYRAVMGFIAERYSRPDCKYGWISSYVVGNEVQAHWTWYNMGRPSEAHFLDEYMKAVRVTDLALRDTHPDLRALISMEHHWSAPVDLTGIAVIEGVAKRARMEGDFPWYVAFHPYPQDLFQPNFLKDDQAVLRFDTPKITFRNLEVLPVYLAQPRMLYRGRRRKVALTEQGFNITNDPNGELVQAAAYAAAYYRVAHIDGIDAFNLYQHISSKGDFGLKMGLYDWPEDNSQLPYGRKLPSWEAFRVSGTPGAEQKLAYLLPALGAKSWKQLLPASKIDRTPPKPVYASDNLVVDLCTVMDRATLVGIRSGMEWRQETVTDGMTFQKAILSHPPLTGTGYGTMIVKLPKITAKQKLVFVASTGFSANSIDGVDWVVLVNDKPLAKGTQTDRAWKPLRIDLSRWAGQSIRLCLGVNARKDTGYDWFCWMKPAILKLSAAAPLR
ncbi:MAG: DUF5722 domain-containing protein [Armatimonadota bacterium]